MFAAAVRRTMASGAASSGLMKKLFAKQEQLTAEVKGLEGGLSKQKRKMEKVVAVIESLLNVDFKSLTSTGVVRSAANAAFGNVTTKPVSVTRKIVEELTDKFWSNAIVRVEEDKTLTPYELKELPDTEEEVLQDLSATRLVKHGTAVLHFDGDVVLPQHYIGYFSSKFANKVRKFLRYDELHPNVSNALPNVYRRFSDSNLLLHERLLTLIQSAYFIARLTKVKLGAKTANPDNPSQRGIPTEELLEIQPPLVRAILTAACKECLLQDTEMYTKKVARDTLMKVVKSLKETDLSAERKGRLQKRKSNSDDDSDFIQMGKLIKEAPTVKVATKRNVGKQQRKKASAKVKFQRNVAKQHVQERKGKSRKTSSPVRPKKKSVVAKENIASEKQEDDDSAEGGKEKEKSGKPEETSSKSGKGAPPTSFAAKRQTSSPQQEKPARRKPVSAKHPANDPSSPLQQSNMKVNKRLASDSDASNSDNSVLSLSPSPPRKKTKVVQSSGKSMAVPLGRSPTKLVEKAGLSRLMDAMKNDALKRAAAKRLID